MYKCVFVTENGGKRAMRSVACVVIMDSDDCTTPPWHRLDEFKTRCAETYSILHAMHGAVVEAS